ncbi:MAG TPA: DoxX family protein [Candidatus Acidoferrales bacterium]|nr:DoxX family protein [Candidatus Acidoferrales bacterium]
MYPIGADLALLIIRVAVGLIIAAHGAQKLFGVFGGPGLAKFQGMVASMGFVQPRVMGTLAAFTEFFGGLALAIGLYLPVVAAMLCVDMLVAVFKVHAPKGFFVQGGGYEYPLLLAIVFAVIGVVSDPVFFAVALVVGAGLTLVAATIGSPAEVRRAAPR